MQEKCKCVRCGELADRWPWTLCADCRVELAYGADWGAVGDLAYARGLRLDESGSAAIITVGILALVIVPALTFVVKVLTGVGGALS